MQEPVEFTDPQGNMGYSESTKASMGGGKATKTVTRTYKMSDGSSQVVVKTVTRDV